METSERRTRRSRITGRLEYQDNGELVHPTFLIPVNHGPKLRALDEYFLENLQTAIAEGGPDEDWQSGRRYPERYLLDPVNRERIITDAQADQAPDIPCDSIWELFAENDWLASQVIVMPSWEMGAGVEGYLHEIVAGLQYALLDAHYNQFIIDRRSVTMVHDNRSYDVRISEDGTKYLHCNICSLEHLWSEAMEEGELDPPGYDAGCSGYDFVTWQCPSCYAMHQQLAEEGAREIEQQITNRAGGQFNVSTIY